MSLVENIVGQISTKGLGGITSPQGFDMSDDTFEKILGGKMINGAENPDNNDKMVYFGAPAGLVIEPIDAPQTTKEVKPINTEEVQIKDIDLTDFFTNVIKNNSEDDKGILDLAKKHAVNAYNTFAGKYVTDLKDLISDTLAMTQAM